MFIEVQHAVAASRSRSCSAPGPASPPPASPTATSLDTASPDTAARFLRQIVRSIYQHEIDEHLRVGDARPFAPEHVS